MAITVVDSPASLSAALTRLSHADRIGVDTEADSLHSYWHRTCLLQMTAGDEDFIVDPIAVEVGSLAPLFADPGIEKIMHAAENDVRLLKRDYDFRFSNLFDTMASARILGYPRWGLADLLRESFGVELDKRYQRYDWAQRPLAPAAIAYAAHDTHYLGALRDRLATELAESGRTEEAAEEFARIAEIPAADRGFDPNDFWRVKGAHDLSPALRPHLRALHRLRDDEARRINRPPFKVMPDSVLIAVAQAAPHTQNELQAAPGVPPYVAQRYGRALLRAVERSRGLPPLQAERSRPDESVLARYDALRAWRNTRAAARGVEGDVIVSNSVLKALAAAAPRDRDALVQSQIVGPWKLQTYGDEIIDVLAATDRTA
jgi:ribonuclease D